MWTCWRFSLIFSHFSCLYFFLFCCWVGLDTISVQLLITYNFRRARKNIIWKEIGCGFNISKEFDGLIAFLQPICEASRIYRNLPRFNLQTTIRSTHFLLFLCSASVYMMTCERNCFPACRPQTCLGLLRSQFPPQRTRCLSSTFTNHLS